MLIVLYKQQLLGSANYLEVLWKKQVYFVNKTTNQYFFNKITLIRHKLYQTQEQMQEAILTDSMAKKINVAQD